MAQNSPDGYKCSEGRLSALEHSPVKTLLELEQTQLSWTLSWIQVSTLEHHWTTHPMPTKGFHLTQEGRESLIRGSLSQVSFLPSSPTCFSFSLSPSAHLLLFFLPFNDFLNLLPYQYLYLEWNCNSPHILSGNFSFGTLHITTQFQRTDKSFLCTLYD